MSEGYKAQTSAHVQTYLQMRKHESVTDVDRYTETDTNLNMDKSYIGKLKSRTDHVPVRDFNFPT